MPPAAGHNSSSAAPGGIHTPGSIWQRALEQKATSKQAASRPDAHVYFVGAASSGKSTLISRFLYPAKAEPAKPSPGLEYTFARKAAAYDPNRKDIAHVWELAGGEALSAQLTQGSHIFLTHRQVTHAVVVIVLDLSDPPSLLPNALHWLGLVRQKLAATYGLFERRGLAQLPGQLKTRQRSKTFAQQHADAQLVDCPGVSLVFACTKWDALKDRADPEGLRLLSHALRWLAHSNAAHLVYLGGLQPGANGPEGAKLLDSFSRLVNHLAFVGMDRKLPLKQQPSTDHLGPLLVPAGYDSFSSIGLPHSSSSSSSAWDAASVAARQQQWVEAVGRVWQGGAAAAAGSKQQQQQQSKSEGGQGNGTAVAFTATYQEEEVDGAYQQREAALEAYRQELRGAAEEAKRSRRRGTATAVAGAAAGGTAVAAS